MADTEQAPAVTDSDGGPSSAKVDPEGSAPQAEGADLTKTVADHYNKLQESGLDVRTKSRIFYMRNFNNWIKSILIGETLTKVRKEKPSHSTVTILDLCSGKGGDFLKWKKGNVDKVVCADIAGTSVEQSESRYKDMQDRNRNERHPSKLFAAEFYTADCTKQRLKDMYKDPRIKFDLVSCQFSFHYCFESQAQAEVMLRNAAECMHVGGYFIGTTPNSNELVRRWREAEGNSFKNEVCSIEFESDDKEDIPLFGAKYDFNLEGVVNCPEFLVYFPLLEKMAERHGLKLVYKKPFAQFFQENSTAHEGRGLLGRMQALEPYPADQDVDLSSSEPDAYTVAAQHIAQLAEKETEGQSQEQQRRRPQKVGTMSKAEWGASTLYLVFVFKKVAEGQVPSPTPSGAPTPTPSGDPTPTPPPQPSDSINLDDAMAELLGEEGAEESQQVITIESATLTSPTTSSTRKRKLEAEDEETIPSSVAKTTE